MTHEIATPYSYLVLQRTPWSRRDDRKRLMAERPSRRQLARVFGMVARDRSTGCWNWLGATAGGRNDRKYSAIANGTAHAVTYAWFVGPMPSGLQLDHLCCNTLCINPAHLEAVTPRENVRRTAARMTHCKNGHSRALYLRQAPSKAWCLLCSRENRRLYRQQQKEAANHAASA